MYVIEDSSINGMMLVYFAHLVFVLWDTKFAKNSERYYRLVLLSLANTLIYPVIMKIKSTQVVLPSGKL